MSNLLLIAFLTEALTEVLKNAAPVGAIRDRITFVVSILVGVALSFAFNVDVFGLAGIGHYVSIVASGLIASRGANYVNGFLKQIGVLKSGGAVQAIEQTVEQATPTA